MGRGIRKSISKRLYFYIFLILLPLVLLSVFIYLYKAVDDRGYMAMYNSFSVINESPRSVERIVQSLRLAAQSNIDETEREVGEDLEALRADLDLVKEIIDSSHYGSLHILIGMEEIVGTLEDVCGKVIRLAGEGDLSLELYENLELAELIVDIYRDNVVRFLVEELSYREEQSLRIRRNNTLLGGVIVIISLFCLLIVLVIVLFIRNNILWPMERLEEELVNYYEEGNYALHPVERDDEIGHMQKAFNQMFTKIQDREAELVQLKNYLLDIINSLSASLIGIDDENRVTLWNRTISEVTGISREEALERDLGDLVPELIPILSKFSHRNGTGEILNEKIVAGDGEEGSSVWEVSAFPVCENDHEGAVIRIDDVTERLRIEQVLVQNEKMLALGGLAAGMAHEIRNPMTAVLTGSEILTMWLSENKSVTAGKRKEIREITEAIKTSSEKVVDIIASMLSFSRKSDEKKSLTNPVDLLEQTLTILMTDKYFRPGYLSHPVRIIKDIQGDIPPVPCIIINIQQVILNIVKNAAHALEEEMGRLDGDPRVIIRMNSDRDRQLFMIEIEDNGPGMAPDVAEHIFEPFFTTKASGVGTGLGLSVSHYIITETHGGTIQVESEPGRGTKFLITLPLNPGDRQ